MKALIAATAAFAVMCTQVISAAACGGLVAPNGAIRLTRASTLVDWRDGVEHYMTSFAYAGTAVKDFGWIVPLPAVPDKVEEGGGWTLQRLDRETHPVFDRNSSFQLATGAAAVEVLQQVKVRALDITVLRGSGQAIVDWCAENSFLLTPETRAHLLVYAKASPIFMAAKYNIERAQASRQRNGDGAPVLITMHTPNMWVPLEVLATGTDHVSADLYLMTREPVYASELARALGESAEGAALPGVAGFTVQYQKPLSDNLFRDLSSDKNMGWVASDSWLTYLTLEAPSQTVTYDLQMTPAGVVKLATYGGSPTAASRGTHMAIPYETDPSGRVLPPGSGTLAFWGFILALLAGAMFLAFRPARQEPSTYSSSDRPGLD
jgi:hypothetical protein